MQHYRTCERCGGAVYAPPSEVALGKGLYCSRACRFGTETERFWARVLCGVTPSACWRWTGPPNSATSLYGRCRWQGKSRLAHHVSYLLHVGPIPDGMVVRHRCPGGGNPWCVNPDHLAIGTWRDNAQDMLDDGRHWSQSGAWSPARRARPEGVVGEMRELVLILQRTTYRRLATLAKERGVSLQQLAVDALAAI
jgi:hypothetical protein